MKLGIMQPYFFPYIGYFNIIKNTDKFILLDEVQFIYHGWIERNRILKPCDGVQYIKVPLEKHSREEKICNIRINNKINWKSLIIRQVEHYKKKAPYYNDVLILMDRCFEIDTNNIVILNKHILEVVCEYLGINADISIFSDLKLNIERPQKPDEWALNICKVYGNVDEYWNPEGGAEFFDCTKYMDKNIETKFVSMNLKRYNQKRDKFEGSLSIIDVMMFNSKKEILEMIDNYSFI